MPMKRLRNAGKLAFLELVRRLPDDVAVSLDHMRVFGRPPELRRPRRFTDKIQHLKLYNRNPRMPALVDKVLAKRCAAGALGSDWIIPTHWSGDRVTPELLRAAPKPSVLKANHASAHVIFLRDDTDFDAAARMANEWLRYDLHLLHREWPYGDVRRQLLIEQFVGERESPDDYKFWAFDGRVRLVQVDQGRFAKHTRQFYTADWRRLDLKLMYPNAGEDAPKPLHLAEMLRAAETLAADFRFVRVDLYDTADGPLFGEMTFFPEAGLCAFKPTAFDFELGEAWAYPDPGESQRLATPIVDRADLSGDSDDGMLDTPLAREIVISRSHASHIGAPSKLNAPSLDQVPTANDREAAAPEGPGARMLRRGVDELRKVANRSIDIGLSFLPLLTGL